MKWSRSRDGAVAQLKIDEDRPSPSQISFLPGDPYIYKPSLTTAT